MRDEVPRIEVVKAAGARAPAVTIPAGASCVSDLLARHTYPATILRLTHWQSERCPRPLSGEPLG